ncbi:hypothetical protein MBLNU457_7184t1 [Dothideomycetes sp. NU457]
MDRNGIGNYVYNNSVVLPACIAMIITKCDISCADESIVRDVELSGPSENSLLPPHLSLTFLSLVNVSKIPFYLRIGPTYDVNTTIAATESWFDGLLLSSEDQAQDGVNENAWWQTARIESPLGVLVKLETKDPENGNNFIPTELLFFASKRQGTQACPPTPPRSSQGRVDLDELEETDGSIIELKAVALCSNLIHQIPADDITPPPSPTINQAEREGQFLHQFSLPTDSVQDSQKSKRKSAATTLDEALDRRKRPRKVSAELNTASTNRQPTRQPLQTRPLSRSPSLSASLPPSRRASITVETTQQPKKSSLSRVPSVNDKSFNETEQKNKDTISRAVMAGMRLHGLFQSKTRRAERKGSIMLAESETASKTDEEVQTEREKDEEFKLVYHQVYKGVCFAFRKHIDTIDLKGCTTALQDCVDRLLALFCSDPLADAAGDAGRVEDATDSGRVVFGSATRKDESPWGATHGDKGSEAIMTPSLRRKESTRSITTVERL